MDFVPRFFQGDSVSYLSTQIGQWVPPDRSWEFGLMVNFLLRHTHGLSAFIFIQIGVLIALVEGMRCLFAHRACGALGWVSAALMLAIDPLMELYARFYMSDFLAMGFFLFAIGGLILALRPGKTRTSIYGAASLILLGTLGAVFFRVAYALIILLSVVLSGLLLSRRLTRRDWGKLVLAGFVPVVAVLAVVGANRVMFAKEFPGQFFATKLSGVFLAGVFTPALHPEDFARAGIPVTAEEYAKLDLSNYQKRVVQVWGHDPSDLHQLIKDKLHISADYTAAVDRAASKLVASAFERDPLAFLKVYLVSALDYVRPDQWRRQVPGEMGLTRPLPDFFVAFVNRYAVLKVTPEITTVRSLLIRIYTAASYAYPFLLLLGLGAGFILLWTQGVTVGVVVPFAAFLADLASAPLYGNYLIARYVLAAIFLAYLLIGLGISDIVTRMFPEEKRDPAP
ncbi:hypothetical protein [Acidisoma sp. 7E03]